MFPFHVVGQHYEFPGQLWNAFVNMAGNLGEDLKLLAVLVGTALERTQLPDGSVLTAVQESRVGMVCNLAKRPLHSRKGGKLERAINPHSWAKGQHQALRPDQPRQIRAPWSGNSR